MNPDATGFKEAGIEKEIISTTDAYAVLEAAKKHSIDGIMTLASDIPMRTVALVSTELGLAGISNDTALKATNKAVMRQCLKEHNVPVPDFFKVSDKNEYFEAVRHFKASFIVKPADNSGSRGVFLVDSIDDAKIIEEAYIYSHQYSRSGDVVVEEYMQGLEVSVETLTVDGECHVIQITDKLTNGAPHFVETGHSQPACLSSETAEQIGRAAKAANRAVGITNGPSHTEIIVTGEGPKIVELGARLGGDCITTHLVPLSTGVNMVECCIRSSLGEKPDIERKFSKGSAIRYFRQKAGTVKSIQGVEEAEKLDGVKQISFVIGVGMKITNIINSAARMGFVIAQSDSAEHAVSICEQAMDRVRIEIE